MSTQNQYRPRKNAGPRVYLSHDARKTVLAAPAPALFRRNLAAAALKAAKPHGAPIWCLPFGFSGLAFALSAVRGKEGDLLVEVGTATRNLPFLRESALPIKKGRTKVSRRR
jgi:hypothetical protein